MELVNQTPVVAEAKLTEDEETGQKYGLLLAKATFLLGEDGTPELDSQDPYPLFLGDEETELGVLPSDLYPRRDPKLEVILLGAAYGEGDHGSYSRTVELSLGDVTRRMLVFGDRSWDGHRRISSPEAFHRIPLTYQNAFGGSCEAYLDEHTVVDVEDTMNKYGKGFDGVKQAEDLAAGFRAPSGYPKVSYARMLPNLENPEALIARWEDTPEPYCWATLPADIGFRMIEMMRDYHRHGEPADLPIAQTMVYHRAHPDWIIDLPPPGAVVAMKGLTPDRGSLAFELPRVRVIADYVVGDRTGARELAPQLLMLLPEERRFYLVFRSTFMVDLTPDMERSFRLRLEEGWFQYDERTQTGHGSPGTTRE